MAKALDITKLILILTIVVIVVGFTLAFIESQYGILTLFIEQIESSF